jgi:hypothetical protein
METAISPPAAIIAFLQELGADKVEHRANRDLLEHLVATYDLLRAWRHDEPVAIAGLMHSVYGTAAFETACLPPSERARVRNVIGSQAERLAFLFSAMDRDQFLNTLGDNKVVSRFDGEQIKITDEETRIMCEILFANELDLAIAKKGADRPDKIEKKLGPTYTQIADYISPEAKQAYLAAITTGQN